MPALEPGESYVEPVFLLVETGFDDDGETVTTIDQITSGVVHGRHRWEIVTLGQSVPMSHAAAREWAVSYAASRDIPLVYERDSTQAAYAASLQAGAGPPAASSASK